jgi:hypothetical protein
LVALPLALVPAGTPRPLVDKLHGALLATLGLPAGRLRLIGGGAGREKVLPPGARAIEKLVPVERIELPTFALRMRCSTS